MKLPHLAPLLLLAGVVEIPAQNFSLPWFTLDGGGGSSAGGPYAVHGTIGQPDAGSASGGSFTVQGGFWGVYSVAPTPEAPMLFIESVPGRQVRLSWSLPAAGFQLEQAAAAMSPAANTAWTLVAAAPQTNGVNVSVITPAAAGHRLFRLRRP